MVPTPIGPHRMHDGADKQRHNTEPCQKDVQHSTVASPLVYRLIIPLAVIQDTSSNKDQGWRYLIGHSLQMERPTADRDNYPHLARGESLWVFGFLSGYVVLGKAYRSAKRRIRRRPRTRERRCPRSKSHLYKSHQFPLGTPDRLRIPNRLLCRVLLTRER